MCLTRPGYKADDAADDDVKAQWRMEWPGHAHRVAVKPETLANTLCGLPMGPEICQEVIVGSCPLTEPPPPLPCHDDYQKVLSLGDCGCTITIQCPPK
jgi:hypothetical protein